VATAGGLGRLWERRGQEVLQVRPRCPIPLNIRDEQFDRALTERLDDPDAQDVSVSIKLECSGFVLPVSGYSQGRSRETRYGVSKTKVGEGGVIFRYVNGEPRERV
jgi:hypothetical protein